MKNFGLFLDLVGNDIGIDLGLVMDAGMGYEFPYYSDFPYNIWEFRPNALIGGKSYVTISLFFFRVTVFFDVIGAKLTSAIRGKFDVVDKNSYCYSSDWFAEVVKLIITAKIDVNECNGGLLAFFAPGNLRECSWKNYYIDYPLYTLDPLNSKYQWSDTLINEKCNSL